MQATRMSGLRFPSAPGAPFPGVTYFSEVHP